MSHGDDRPAGPTSISDVDHYRDFCRLAATNDIAFASFRRNPNYGLVDGLDPESGQDYAEVAFNMNETMFLSHFNEWARADLLGGQHIHHVRNIGDMAPSTIRYAKVAMEIVELFGPLAGMDVAEIGAGYGGQCRALSVLGPMKSYAIYDLPEPMMLAKRFLSNYPEVPDMHFRDVFATPAQDFDLVISNYAFGELSKTVQDTYFSRVIDRAKRGYMIYNATFFADKLEGFTYLNDEVMARIPGAQLVPVEKMPRSDAKFGNVLIHWDRSRT